MFFKIGSIKKLMQKAYKGEGLTVGRDQYDEDRHAGYYISGKGWTIWNDERQIPNVLKAAIVEFCGNLPEYGEEFMAQAGADYLQHQIQDGTMHLPNCKVDAGVLWEPTPLYIVRTGTYRILQSNGNRIETVAIPSGYWDMVKPDEIDSGAGESNCQGPYRYGTAAIWRNNICWFKAQTYCAEVDADLFRHLDKYNINGET